MWPTTGMSTRLMAWIVSAITTPPSSFTQPAPAFISRIALATPCSGLTWYEPNGRSPTTSAAVPARATIRTWYAISSSSTGIVVCSPCTTVATESPTRIMSTPAASTIVANVAS